MDSRNNSASRRYSLSHPLRYFNSKSDKSRPATRLSLDLTHENMRDNMPSVLNRESSTRTSLDSAKTSNQDSILRMLQRGRDFGRRCTQAEHGPLCLDKNLLFSEDRITSTTNTHALHNENNQRRSLFYKTHPTILIKTDTLFRDVEEAHPCDNCHCCLPVQKGTHCLAEIIAFVSKYKREPAMRILKNRMTELMKLHEQMQDQQKNIEAESCIEAIAMHAVALSIVQYQS